MIGREIVTPDDCFFNLPFSELYKTRYCTIKRVYYLLPVAPENLSTMMPLTSSDQSHKSEIFF